MNRSNKALGNSPTARLAVADGPGPGTLFYDHPNPTQLAESLPSFHTAIRQYGRSFSLLALLTLLLVYFEGRTGR
ncbi:MAG: hypothetical protein IPP88_24445, partial [Betaproteobacteria bacterium]|nr:hypothetical protein [Betaproteobacteria bacterium]